MRKIKIAYIIEKFPSSTEHFILNEIIGLNKKGIELTVLVVRKQKRYLDVPGIKELNVPVIYLPRFFIFYSVFLLLRQGTLILLSLCYFSFRNTYFRKMVNEIKPVRFGGKGMMSGNVKLKTLLNLKTRYGTFGKKRIISACPKTQVSDKKTSFSRLAKTEKAAVPRLRDEHFSVKRNKENGVFLQTLIKKVRKQPSWLKYIRNYCVSIYFRNKLTNIKIDHVHAHFAFIATDIAKILSEQLRVKHSFTAHAMDIYTQGVVVKEKLGHAAFAVTCSNYNKEYLDKLTQNHYKEKLYSVYHGVNTKVWQSKSSQSYFKETIKILAIARLVEKKGLVYLLKAVGKLVKQGYNIQCRIIGEGPLRDQLENLIVSRMVHNHVRIYPFLYQNQLKQHYYQSDVFVLPCIYADDGDRDGIPNVILESMACGVPVITTPISGIPEVIENMKTGILVKEKDDLAIVDAIKLLHRNKRLYYTISKNAKEKIVKEFNLDDCIDKLIQIFKKNIIVHY